MARSTGPTRATRFAVRVRAGDMCEKCGNRPIQQIHHRRPRRMGGSRDAATNSPSNLLGLCNDCHVEVESNRHWSYVNGWVLLATVSPEDIPVRVRGVLVYLTPDGRYSLADEVEWEAS